MWLVSAIVSPSCPRCRLERHELYLRKPVLDARELHRGFLRGFWPVPAGPMESHAGPLIWGKSLRDPARETPGDTQTPWELVCHPSCCRLFTKCRERRCSSSCHIACRSRSLYRTSSRDGRSRHHSAPIHGSRYRSSGRCTGPDHLRWAVRLSGTMGTHSRQPCIRSSFPCSRTDAS